MQNIYSLKERKKVSMGNIGMEPRKEPKRGRSTGAERRRRAVNAWNGFSRGVDAVACAVVCAIRAMGRGAVWTAKALAAACRRGLAQVKTLKPTVQALCIALCAVLVCGLALSVRPAVRLATVKNVTLSDDAMTVQVKTHARTVAELLTEYDITLGEGDVVYPTLSDPVHKGDEILVRRAISVRVTADGETRQVSILNGTVSKALYLAGVEVDANDIVQPGKLESVSAGMEIVVNRVTISQESEKQRIPYHVTYQDDDDLYLGKEKMVKQGTEGVKEVTYRVVTVDGVETERSVSSEAVLEAAQNRIVAKGTKPTPTPTPKPTPKPTATPKKTTAATKTATPSKTTKATATAKPKTTPDPNKKNASDVTDNTITVDGKTYTYSKTLTVMITAYTHTGRKTSTGVWPKVGTVAVDKSVIPYGTKLYIPGYGFGVAQDTGVSGNHIDVFFDTEAECTKFGRKRDRTIYILD